MPAPDFESAYIDSDLVFQLVPTEAVTEPEEGEELSSSEEEAEGPVADDPAYRMSKLAAANREPVRVSPDATVTEAITIMLANDFSQLPVMPNERDVKGIFSWASLGSRVVLGQEPRVVSECMDNHAEIRFDASMFSAIPTIVEHQYVLVRDLDRRIVGIVTTSDLSLQFMQLAEPFLLIGEIENQMRNIIGSHFEPTELAEAADPDDSERSVQTVADLTFGEYVRLLEKPDRWDRLQLGIDRAQFVQLLDRIRIIRNDVMHFDPDGVPEEDLKTLRDFANFLRRLRTIGSVNQ